MTGMNKAEMRRFIRPRHEGNAARDVQSQKMCRHILDSGMYKSAQVIGGYMAMPREADITPVLLDALRQGKVLALPRCGKPPEMTFRKVQSLNELHNGAYGIPEPAEDAPIVPVEDIQLMLVPLEGIDLEGFRLGKGGGYYDNMLAGCTAPKLGCALSWQRVEEVPRDPWDVKLTACADENGIHLFKL